MKLLFVLIAILLFGVIAFYNRKILQILDDSLGKSERVFYRYLGKHIRNWNVRYDRTAAITDKSRISAIDKRLKEIIVNLDMSKDNVTTVGLLLFMASTSFVLAFVCSLFLSSMILSLLLWVVLFYLIFVLFDFVSLLRFEKKEADIMDAEDLIAMDIKGGVQNAISRYKDSFNPRVKPYFTSFLDSITKRGSSFEAAMRELNVKLGDHFDDFASKAIMYEKDADGDMDDIFSTVIEMNRIRREVRHNNNIKFNEMRLQFIVALGLVGILASYLTFTESFIRAFLLGTFWGQALLVLDVVIVAGVLAYMAKIKARL